MFDKYGSCIPHKLYACPQCMREEARESLTRMRPDPEIAAAKRHAELMTALARIAGALEK